MKNILILLAVLAALAGGILIGWVKWHPKNLDPGSIHYDTITVNVPKYIEKPVPYKVIIPAHITYKYMSYEDSMKLVTANDSMIMLVASTSLSDRNGRHDTVRIRSGFLTAFPTQPKLVNCDLRLDSVDFTLLNINAELFTKRYPLDLFNYRYRFDGVNMSVDPISHRFDFAQRAKWELGLNGYLGTDLISYPLVPSVNLELEISRAWFRFRLEPEMTITRQPEFGVNVKAGVGIWKR